MGDIVDGYLTKIFAQAVLLASTRISMEAYVSLCYYATAMASDGTHIARTTLVAGLFYRQGWHYYIGPKITPTSSDEFLTKEDADAALQQQLGNVVASLAPQWDVTIEWKDWRG